jgi:hypothetical protein
MLWQTTTTYGWITLSGQEEVVQRRRATCPQEFKTVQDCHGQEEGAIIIKSKADCQDQGEVPELFKRQRQDGVGEGVI